MFIEVTKQDGNKTFINLNNIIDIEPCSSPSCSCMIYFTSGRSHGIKETYDDIVEIVRNQKHVVFVNNCW